MLIAAHGPERGRLLCWPRPYPENPYLTRLLAALAARGVTTESARYLAELVARPGRARWLHLHWPEWMTQDPVRLRARARTAWLLALLETARARGVSVAWTAHNLIGHDAPHRDLALLARRALLTRCAVVFGHFASAERDVRELGFAGRFVLAPHGHYRDDYPSIDRASARAALGWSRDETVLLAFGAIEPYKGFDRIALEVSRQRIASLRLHVAGAPRSPSAVRALERAAGASPAIQIEARHASPGRVSQLMAAADALVLGYRDFYTSGTAMLALGFGTPVLGPCRHHLADFAHAPFFVPLESPTDLADAVATLRSRGGQARVAAEDFARTQTWDRAAHAIARALCPEAVA